MKNSFDAKYAEIKLGEDRLTDRRVNTIEEPSNTEAQSHLFQE